MAGIVESDDALCVFDSPYHIAVSLSLLVIIATSTPRHLAAELESTLMNCPLVSVFR